MGFMSQNIAVKENTAVLRWIVIAAIAAVAFFGSYRFAQASSAVPAAGAATSGVVAAAGTAGTPQAATAGGGCCGSGASGSAASGSTSGGGGCCGGSAKSGPAVTKKATVAGNVQTASVDLSKGYYDPNTIELKAGVPAEITFGQASGCLSQVQSQQLGFFEDLTKGAVTIKLPALPAGTYTFTCGMQMQSGTIVVK
jgi:hypothetical protein